MNFSTFYSIESLLLAADRIMDGCDAVTIDLFDTLLIRRVHDPDMVKPAVARFIAAKTWALGLPEWTWQAVQQVRDTEENLQRADTATRFEDHEACYPVFMRRALSRIFGEEMGVQLLETVTDYELAVESAVLVPRAAWLPWLEKMHRKGKKIIVVSDVYLPATHLKRLVESAGLSAFITDVVSSADSFLAKASGKAFPLLEERYGLVSGRWLHIGDNPFSDGLRPVSFGIRALVLKDRKEAYRKTIARLYTVFSNRVPYWHGRLLQQIMLPLEAENRRRPFLYVEGYNFFGFLLGFLTQGIVEKIRENRIRKIFFFSREGWTFKKYWDRAVPYLLPGELAPESRYLYVSRLALAGASCAYLGLPKEKADIAFLPPGNRDMRDFCRVFSLDMASLRDLMERYGIDETTPVSPGHSMPGYIRFVNMIRNSAFQEEVKRQTRPANDALQLYLESVGFFDAEDVALVDVGWLGTIQRFLYDAVSHRKDKPRFHGLLFAASRGIPFPTTSDNTVTGILYDRAQNDFAGSTILYARDLFEEAFRAPHPSLVRYERTSMGFRLVFRMEDDDYATAEGFQDAHFEPLRYGMLDAAVRFGAANAIAGFGTVDLRPWLNYLLVSKMAFPRTQEVKVIKQRYHMDDFGGRNPTPKAITKSQRHLWDLSMWSLRLPWVRLRTYLRKPRPI